MMSKRVSIPVLVLVSLGVFLSHVSWREKDNGYVVVVDEREHDVLGMAQQQWVQLKRNCTRISTFIAPSTQAQIEPAAQASNEPWKGPHAGPQTSQQAVHHAVQQAVRSYSPPHSSSARVLKLWATEQWALAELAFDGLLPAVVLFKLSGEQAEIVPNAIWSGDTRPWLAVPLIRRYLKEQEPQAPAELLDCFGPLIQFQN